MTLEISLFEHGTVIKFAEVAELEEVNPTFCPDLSLKINFTGLLRVKSIFSFPISVTESIIPTLFPVIDEVLFCVGRRNIPVQFSLPEISVFSGMTTRNGIYSALPAKENFILS